MLTEAKAGEDTRAAVFSTLSFSWSESRASLVLEGGGVESALRFCLASNATSIWVRMPGFTLLKENQEEEG